MFGDVARVKVLRNKSNVALIEFWSATMAAIAVEHMDGVLASAEAGEFDKPEEA
jgi:hypothetical protein